MIDVELVGGDAVIAKLDAMPTRLHDELKKGIGKLAFNLAKKVQNEKLRGQVLNYKSGRLWNSIGNVVADEGDTISGIVSTPVKYGRAHEYGFRGTVTVKEHMRRQTMAFGRPMEPKQVTVAAHQTKMNLPERSFLRSALREFQAAGVISEEINAALARATKG